jgi:mono/diheme cytochrome c family protein
MIRLVLLVFILLSACTQGTHPESSSGLPSVQSESGLPETAKPTLKPPRKFAKGEALYIRYCADCHGWEGQSDGPAAEFLSINTPALNRGKFFNKHSEDELVDWVLHGKALNIPLSENAIPRSQSEITELLDHIRKLPKINWEEVNAGQEVYYGLCVGCHGLYGRGDGDWASQMSVSLPDLSMSHFQKKYGDQQLLKIITEGKGAMPGAGDTLNPEQLGNVVSFLRLLSPGFQRYDRFCAACHGPDGSPVEYVVIDEEGVNFDRTNIPTFDATYIKNYTDAQLGRRVQHMLEVDGENMPHFSGELKPDEVRQILRYLRGLT